MLNWITWKALVYFSMKKITKYNLNFIESM